jgi:hypothetical protein
MKRLRLVLLRACRTRRLTDTRPATCLEARLTGRAWKIAYPYARGLFEWTPFWPALLWNHQDRRPR